jgi:multiple sugar transport system substrate-binding protein
LISTGFDYALYVNTAKMRAAGLDPAKPPQTIAELDAYAQKMDVIDPSGHIRVAGYLPFEPGWTLNETPFWFGGSWWDAKHQRFNFNDPHVVEAFRWVQSYSKRLGANAVATYTSGVGQYDTPQNSFMAETIAMETQGTFFANNVQTHDPALTRHWAVFPAPAVAASLTDVTCCASDVLVIPRGAKHPHEAFAFMTYVSRQDVQEKLANLHCKISALNKASDNFLNHHRNPFIRVFERLAHSPNAQSQPDIPIQAEVTDELTNFTDRLRLLDVTPEQGLAELQVTLQAKLDRFNQEQQLRAAQH